MSSRQNDRAPTLHAATGALRPRPPAFSRSTTLAESSRFSSATPLRSVPSKTAPAVTVTLEAEEDQATHKRGREEDVADAAETRTEAPEEEEEAPRAVNGHTHSSASNGHVKPKKAKATEDVSASRPSSAKKAPAKPSKPAATKSPKPVSAKPSKPAPATAKPKKQASAPRTVASEAPEEPDTAEDAATTVAETDHEEATTKRRTYKRKRTETQIQMTALASLPTRITNESIRNALSGMRLRKGVVRVIRSVLTKKMTEAIAGAAARMWIIKNDSVQRRSRLSTLALADSCQKTFNL